MTFFEWMDGNPGTALLMWLIMFLSIASFSFKRK